MRQPLPVALFSAVALCGIAWLIGLLLADSLQLDDSFYPENELISLNVLDALNQTDSPTDMIHRIEDRYGVNLTEFMGDVDAQLHLSDTYPLVLDSGVQYSIEFPSDSQGFFSPRELLHLALQLIAVLTSVLLTIALCNSRLHRLESAVLDIELINDIHHLDDPVERAISTIKDAKTQIIALSEAQKSVATDHRDLLASVAHEFRNPLARLQFANEMAMERTGDDQSALFEEARQASIELDELVRETLRYSRLSNLDRDLSLECLSVEDIFREIAENSTLRNNSSALKIQYPDIQFMIQADKRLFNRALMNLIGNALRYAQHSVTLYVQVDANQLIFHVSDDGPGIPVVHHDKLFEPFYRVERSRSRDTGGFGLGLSIVKSICTRHAASISMSSNSQGSIFSIYWPEYTVGE